VTGGGLSEAIEQMQAAGSSAAIAPERRDPALLVHALASRQGVDVAKVVASLIGDGLAARIARDILQLTEADLLAVSSGRAGKGVGGRPPANPALSRSLFDFAHLQRREEPRIAAAEIHRRFLQIIKADASNLAYRTFRGVDDTTALGRLRQTLTDAERRWSTLSSLFADWPALPPK
jgi:hypothetical protein